ncbi:hypothetical protein PINS_up010629 [Pythium insidiosum]|nr:hypothetical protein PINS_up010629 [Pythium insidiosum]
MQSLEHVFECEGFLPPDHSRPRRLKCRVVVGQDDITIRDFTPSNEAIDPAIFLYQCRLTSLHGHDNRHQDNEDNEIVFGCMFKMAVAWRQQFRSELRICHVTLSSTQGMRGHCMAIGADDGGDGGPRHEIALPVKLRLPLAGDRYSRQPTLLAMTPLIPGDYRLQGFTVTRHGRVYECSVELTLEEDDGVLRGTSRELPALLSCPLKGKWSASELSWTLEYRAGQSVSQYQNELTPSTGGLRGLWRHADADAQPRTRAH